MENKNITRYYELSDKLRTKKRLDTFESKEFFTLIRMALGPNIQNTTCVSCVKALMDRMNNYINALPKEEPIIESPIEDKIEETKEVTNEPTITKKGRKNK